MAIAAAQPLNVQLRITISQMFVASGPASSREPWATVSAIGERRATLGHHQSGSKSPSQRQCGHLHFETPKYRRGLPARPQTRPPQTPVCFSHSEWLAPASALHATTWARRNRRHGSRRHGATVGRMSASESSVIPTTPRTDVIAAAATAVVVPDWIIKVHAIVNVTAVVAIPSKRTMAMINSDSVSTSRQSPPLTLALQQSVFHSANQPHNPLEPMRMKSVQWSKAKNSYS
jgi:hypothetical protein